MRRFLGRHAVVHSWLLLLAILFAVYFYGISSTAAANRVAAVTQIVKDSFAGLWYHFPFSVVEWLYVLFIAACIVWIVVICVGLRRRKGRAILYGRVVGLICFALSAWGLYCLLWGVNYYADGFQEQSGIYAQPVTVEELERVTQLFVEGLSETHDKVLRDENGVFAVERDGIFAESVSVYENAAERFPFLRREDRIPKKMLFSRLFSAMNFTGFYSPYTGEANLNVDCPACLLPATITHELAHQRGIASEQECNFLAVMASIASDLPVYQYSGYLMGYIHLGNALYRADPQKWEAVYAQLPDTVKTDLQYHRAYWSEFEGTTAKVTQKLYDTTLKSYGQENGIQSYGTVVDLLVAYY